MSCTRPSPCKIATELALQPTLICANLYTFMFQDLVCMNKILQATCFVRNRPYWQSENDAGKTQGQCLPPLPRGGLYGGPPPRLSVSRSGLWRRSLPCDIWYARCMRCDSSGRLIVKKSRSSHKTSFRFSFVRAELFPPGFSELNHNVAYRWHPHSFFVFPSCLLLIPLARPA